MGRERFLGEPDWRDLQFPKEASDIPYKILTKIMLTSRRRIEHMECTVSQQGFKKGVSVN